MKKLLSFVSYGYVFTKAGPGELQPVSSPQRDNTHHLLSLCKASNRKPISAGLLGLIQDLQQLLYPFRSYSFNCPYKLDLPDLLLFCRPIFVYKEIYKATQFQLHVGPFIAQPL